MFPLNQSQAYCARLFLDDYKACRNHFREIIRTKKQLESRHEIFSNSVNNLDYDCDAFYLGKQDARKVMVFISGTHGIEGFCGSAIQRYLLTEIFPTLESNDDCAFLFIHALNPWGMANYRRCDELGIDLNRNFIDFNLVPELPDGFSEVHDILLMEDEAERQSELNRLLTFCGQTRFDEVLSGGQYDFDYLPFFGGKEKSFPRKIIEEVIKLFSLDEKELIVIDLHTGLGPWSFGELISDHPAQSSGNDYAKSIFGHAVSVTEEGESFSVCKHGLLDYAWHPFMESKGCFLTLEFGTLGTSSLFQTLIKENLIWRSSCKQVESSESLEKRKAMMLKHFFPKDLLWQQSVLFRAEQIFYQSLEYLNE